MREEHLLVGCHGEFSVQHSGNVDRRDSEMQGVVGVTAVGVVVLGTDIVTAGIVFDTIAVALISICSPCVTAEASDGISLVGGGIDVSQVERGGAVAAVGGSACGGVGDAAVSLCSSVFGVMPPEAVASSKVFGVGTGRLDGDGNITDNRTIRRTCIVLYRESIYGGSSR